MRHHGREEGLHGPRFIPPIFRLPNKPSAHNTASTFHNTHEDLKMDPIAFDITEPGQWEDIGPQPSHMAVSRLFVVQTDIDAALRLIGMTESRDSQLRLEGANLIDALRKSMSL